MTIATIPTRDFSKAVLKSDVPVLATFGASWCRQSNELAPVFEEQFARDDERIRVVSVDVGDDLHADKLLQRFKINRVPVTILFDHGRVVDVVGGVVSPATLGEMVDNHFKPVRDVTDVNFFAEVVRARVPVLVHVDAVACRASVPLRDIVEKIADRFQGQAKVVRLDADGDTAAVRMRYGFTRVPVVAMFHDGELVDQIYGGLSEAALSDDKRAEDERRSRYDNIAEMVETFAR